MMKYIAAATNNPNASIIKTSLCLSANFLTHLLTGGIRYMPYRSPKIIPRNMAYTIKSSMMSYLQIG